MNKEIRLKKILEVFFIINALIGVYSIFKGNILPLASAILVGISLIFGWLIEVRDEY